MNTMPWNYWSDDGTPRPEIVPVIAALETIIARNSAPSARAAPLYTCRGGILESGPRRGRGRHARQPRAGLRTSRAHAGATSIWRVGRYHDAAEANVRAAAVDEAYIAQCNAQGFYPAVYYPHNIHFLWAAASMEGRSAVAIEAARKVAANVRLEQIEQFPAVEFLHTIPLLALVQFGRWDELLAEPAPRADLASPPGSGTTRAAVALGKHRRASSAARAEAAALAPLKANDKILFLDGVDYPASALLAIAEELALGEIAMASDDAAGRDCAFRAQPSLGRMRCRTPSRRFGTTRRANHLGSRCCAQDGPPTRKRYTARIWKLTRTTAGQRLA